MALKQGQRILLPFEGEALWHERLLLSHISKGKWIVMTPDEEVQIQDLSDIGRFRLVKPDGSLPLGIRRGHSY
eukprot:7487213-Karenia_brevis.AAC.1